MNSIILQLKLFNEELLKCQTYNEVDICRSRLLAYIESNDVLNALYQEKKQITLNKDSELNTWRNKLHSYIMTYLNLIISKRTLTINRQHIPYIANSIKTDFIENGYISMSFLEFPNLFYHPSISIIFPPKNYIEIVTSNQNLTGVSDLYKLFDDSLEDMMLGISLCCDFEFNIIEKTVFNIGEQENNFNAAFLLCIIYAVNIKLQHYLQLLQKNSVKKVSEKKELPQEILRLSDTYQETFKLISFAPYKTKEKIAKERNLSETTLKDHIEKICEALNIDNGINSLREYLN